MHCSEKICKVHELGRMAILALERSQTSDATDCVSFFIQKIGIGHQKNIMEKDIQNTTLRCKEIIT